MMLQLHDQGPAVELGRSFATAGLLQLFNACVRQGIALPRNLGDLTPEQLFDLGAASGLAIDIDLKPKNTCRGCLKGLPVNITGNHCLKNGLPLGGRCTAFP